MALQKGVAAVTQGGLEWWQHTMSRMVRCRSESALLDLAYDAIRGGLGYDHVTILRADGPNGALIERLSTDRAGRKTYPAERAAPLAGGFYTRLLADARLDMAGDGFVYLDDLLYEGMLSAEEYDDDHVPHTIYVALRTAHAAYGVLAVANRLGSHLVTLSDAFSLVALANALATSIENMTLRAAHGAREAATTAELRQHIDQLERPGASGQRVHAPPLDAVTGLLTHRALLDELDRAVTAAAPFTLLLLDLDNFKLFNETHGHATGDQVLRSFATIVRQVCREDDVAGRYGCDEFAVLLRGAAANKAKGVIRRLESIVRAHPHVTPDDGMIPISVAAGLACYPAEGCTRQELIAGAEAALARAKSGSRAPGRTRHAAELLEDSQVGVLNGLVTTIDSKDRYTREHSEDVTQWALLLARELGLSDDERRVLALAGPLHDVGKIAVPDRILRKPGKLSRAEYETMKHHVLFGVAIIQGVLREAAVLEAVAHHHERWDGSGYPRGLKGLQAPLLGRIMQIADAVSAMRLSRPYRQGLSWPHIVAELRRSAGTQFDPNLVEPFIAAVSRRFGPGDWRTASR